MIKLQFSFSNFDFSANSNPNHLIFDSWIRIGVIFLNILNCLISKLNSSSDLIEFQRYLKNSLIFCGFDPYLPLYPSIRELIFKLVSWDFILTRDRVYSRTARVCFVNGHQACRGSRLILEATQSFDK